MTIGLYHPYHLDESIFLRGIRLVFIFIPFFDEIHVRKHNRPRWDAAFLLRHVWGYSVYLCRMKRTPGLHDCVNYTSAIVHTGSFVCTWSINLVLTRAGEWGGKYTGPFQTKYMSHTILAPLPALHMLFPNGYQTS